MPQEITFYPLGNAETCLLTLENEKYILFDYAAMTDKYDLKEELSSIKEFDVVVFSHAHDDHTKGASDFFYLKHAKKYQSNERKHIKELWISSDFILDTDLENGSDAKILRDEARHRLKEKKGIRVFALEDDIKSWLEAQNIKFEDVKHLFVQAGSYIDNLNLGDKIKVFAHAPFAKNINDTDDKNDNSIVLTVSLYNSERPTNILMTGDAPYFVLEEVVERHENTGLELLNWDIYDIPHHCSYTGLCAENENNLSLSDKIISLLRRGEEGGVMIASCNEITKDTSPPHLSAKEAYEGYTKKSIDFYETMKVKKGEDEPNPITFEIDKFGIALKSSINNSFITTAAPRAG